jgi:hypothetical protein
MNTTISPFPVYDLKLAASYEVVRLILEHDRENETQYRGIQKEQDHSICR